MVKRKILESRLSNIRLNIRFLVALHFTNWLSNTQVPVFSLKEKEKEKEKEEKEKEKEKRKKKKEKEKEKEVDTSHSLV